MENIRILLTGGGSGGHIFPLITLARELKTRAEVYYFGPKDIYAFYLIGEGIPVRYISTGKIRRYFSWRNFFDVPKFIWGLLQALYKIFWLMPNVAFSKGGTGALAVVLACWFYRIPIVIHESDTPPGLSNQISARFAKIIGTGFASAADFFRKNQRIGESEKQRIEWVGNPVRQELLEGRPAPTDAKKSFGFDPTKALILVLGGSQGSSRLNEFVLNSLEGLLDKFQVLHQVGSQNFADYQMEYKLTAKRLPEAKKNHYQFFAYFEANLKEAFSAADLVISRAGAGAIFEVASFGKPAILVPLAESAQDHQRHNAQEYAQSGAAVIIEENNLLGNLVIAEIEKIFSSGERYRLMSQAALKFAKPGAAAALAQDILSLIELN